MQKKISIFLIEDDPVASGILSRSLSKNPNFQVTTFPSAEDGLKAIEDKFPDVLIIDYQLPGMTGIELFDSIRAVKPPAAIVIMTSAIADGGMVLKFIQKGVRNYVIKDDDIIESIQEIILEETREA